MTNTMRQTRGGFSLVELIVVIGLMAMLSTISIGGYFAATRGMTTRGVTQDTASLIRAAMQTCLIEQVPTAVLFSNRRQNTQAKEGAPYGTAVAIKMAGRVSYVATSGGKTATGNALGRGMLVDEFADWNQSYPLDASDSSRQRAIRLYQMSRVDGTSRLSQGVKACSSLMCAWVGYVRMETEYMVNARLTVNDWCNNNNRDISGTKSIADIAYNNGTDCRWGLPIHPDNDGMAISEWHIGDAYGVEIASLDLPHGYIFGTSVPSDAEIRPASTTPALVFYPSDVSAGNYRFNLGGNVEISRVDDPAATKSTSIAKITNDQLKDQD